AAHPAWRRGASGWGPSALLALPAAELLEPEEEVLQHEAHVQLGVDAHGACIGPRGVGAVRLEEGVGLCTYRLELGSASKGDCSAVRSTSGLSPSEYVSGGPPWCAARAPSTNRVSS